MGMKKLNLNAIRIDGGTQPRERINIEVVRDYADGLKAGVEFPPVVVFHDGAEYWLADGFHRWHAHKQAEKASIEVEVRAGTLLDAKLYAVGANGAHGLRRSNEDKRRAVAMVLSEDAWATWPEAKIAEVCCVSRTLVRAILEERHLVEKQDAVRTVERSGKTYQQDTTNIGKAKTPARASAAASAPALTPPLPPAVESSDDLAEARHTISDLAEENDTLRDRLAVEAMDASEEEKTQAAETIRELRARVKALEAENDALKSSRDTYMREASEAKKDAIYWRKKHDKVQKGVAA